MSRTPSTKTAGPDKFDFDYFDNPEGMGYRGYAELRSGDSFQVSWEEIARDCSVMGVRSVIDLGCAKGYLVKAMLACGIHAVGFDVSRYALSFATDLPCHYLDVRDGIGRRADGIFALGVLLYLAKVDLDPVLADIFRSSNQYFFFSSYYRDGRQEVRDPLRTISEPHAWWRDRIEATGFRLSERGRYYDIYCK